VGRVLVVDPTLAGVSGDMLVAALVDLSGKTSVLDELSRSLSKLPHVKEFNVVVEERTVSGFKAKYVRVSLSEVREHITGKDLINYLERVGSDLGLNEDVMKLAKDVLINLLKAEALIHNSTVYDVHLHEVGSVDTIFDVLATLTILDDLGLLKGRRYSLPVAVGGGLVRVEHGLIPSPAYVTLEILKLRNYYVVGGPINEELTTPTGAALLVTLFEPVKYLPLMSVEGVGYGCGSKVFKELPNIVRVILGTSDELNMLSYDDVYVLETNVDDVTGEVLGYVVEKLLSLGALDVAIIPTTTKKGRPGHIVKVICREELVPELTKYLVEGLGTLGVRVLRTSRYVVPRREVRELSIGGGGKEFKVRVKVCMDNQGNIVRVKPEFDDLRRVSEELGIPMSRLVSEVLRRINT
jgi:uncharacterized protein (TIGR00299 family) protein